MPLLKLKTSEKEKAQVPEFLRDDEEVFYCAITNEIFRDYEDFSERMFLCNSMVWTCAMTGKCNLTYQEAVDSEENAKKSLQEFPTELKIPILYLAHKTKRTCFGEMADDVYLYAKDRYFIGENVDTCLTGSKYKASHVLQVIAPTEEEIKNAPINGDKPERNFKLPANLFKYEVELLDSGDSESKIVESKQIRRRGRIFSRDKCKLFLKQYVEQDPRGVFVIKQSALDDFHIHKVTFEQIFDGAPPQFDASRKFEKCVNGVKKKSRQQSLDKFLTKSEDGLKNGNNANLLERMKKRQEEFEKQKQEKKEEAEAMRQKKKEERLLVAGQLRDWYKPKEDLELIDQRKLPVPTPVVCKIPEKHLGDLFMVMEFVNSFSKLLSTNNFFPAGLTIEIMERAITENEVAGPLIDLIQMFLSAIFNCQEEEIAQYKSQLQAQANIKEEPTSDNENMYEASQLATHASTWSIKYQGLPLTRLPLYSLTTSEILRLHLLSSGAKINYTGMRWRYQQRGGYVNEDDPGLYLRLKEPHILKSLAVRNVVELPMEDKIKILCCLVDQLLTYADFRDIVEERLEDLKQAKMDYRSANTAMKKREQEHIMAKMELKKGEKKGPELQEKLDKLNQENEQRKAEHERKIKSMFKDSYKNIIALGEDRAHRRYVKLESVPGLFVDWEENHAGHCLNTVTKLDPKLMNASKTDTEAYLKTVRQTAGGSKSPKKANGLNSSSSTPAEDSREYFMCSADPETCVVHGDVAKRNPKWAFYHKTVDLDSLIENLNVRGHRESELLQNLKNGRRRIEQAVFQTPANSLNSELDIEENLRKSGRKLYKSKYEDANFGYSTDLDCEQVLHSALIENILEMEENIHAGGLGTLLVKDRDKWRNDLHSRNYRSLDKTIAKRADNGRAGTPEDLPKYHDPGLHLGALAQFETEEKDFDNNTVRDQRTEAIRCLAIALAQIGRAVGKRCLQKPLGRLKASKIANKREGMLDRWQQSLLASTNFSQIFLHYSTLDSCILWAKSALLARCRICRRQNDSENMLLCDQCNMGHHLYCLKPKLTSVPVDDWYCNNCEKTRKDEEKAQLELPEPPAKKRRIFRDEEEDEEEHSEAKSETGDSDDEEEDDNLSDEHKVEICGTCASGGELICCEKCSENYHIECVEPPLRRAPRGAWTCHHCKRREERRVVYDRGCLSDSVGQRTAAMNGQRRCATKALFKIQSVAKNLRRLSDSDSSSNDSNNEVIAKRGPRRDDGRSDLPLHNAALHEVLSEVMKDEDCWPFLRPVQKNDVPDYYQVISQPMDFGTIKYKLNMGEYTEDAQFMADAVIIFQNCNTYNHTEDEVYKCGVRLLKHFQKKCRELGLKLPDEMDYGNESEGRSKKRMRAK